MPLEPIRSSTPPYSATYRLATRRSAKHQPPFMACGHALTVRFRAELHPARHNHVPTQGTTDRNRAVPPPLSETSPRPSHRPRRDSDTQTASRRPGVDTVPEPVSPTITNPTHHVMAPGTQPPPLMESHIRRQSTQLSKTRTTGTGRTPNSSNRRLRSTGVTLIYAYREEKT